MRQPVYEVKVLYQCDAHIYIAVCMDLGDVQSRLASTQWEAAIQLLLSAAILD